MKVHKVELQRKPGKAQQWTWHAFARNGRKLGWTGEAHKSRGHCLEALIAVVDPFNRGIPVFEGGLDGKRTQVLGRGL